MKKLLSTVVLSAMACISLNADYKLVLTDADGNQTQECIKSYSFFNNLESIAKQNGLGKDIYSEEEIMTNKVYMGKPIYRKIVTIPPLSASYTWHEVMYINPPTSYESFISAKFLGINLYGLTEVSNNPSKLEYKLMVDKIGYSFGTSRNNWLSNKKVIVEYTKTTDTADTSSNTFKSYLHYVKSSSTTENGIIKDMKNLGVQFLEGYSYNPDTSSCDKIQ